MNFSGLFHLHAGEKPDPKERRLEKSASKDCLGCVGTKFTLWLYSTLMHGTDSLVLCFLEDPREKRRDCIMHKANRHPAPSPASTPALTVIAATIFGTESLHWILLQIQDERLMAHALQKHDTRLGTLSRWYQL